MESALLAQMSVREIAPSSSEELRGDGGWPRKFGQRSIEDLPRHEAEDYISIVHLGSEK